MTPDFAGLAELLGMAETAAHAALMVFLRVGAAMALLPAFGEQTVPQRLRLIAWCHLPARRCRAPRL